MTSVKQGLPDPERVLRLLDSAYDGWGDQKLFEWKYKDYPDFKEDEVFYIESEEGDLASFGRVFSKELVVKNFQKKVQVYVIGDAAVSPSHQGEGLYSNIHKARVDYSKNQDVEAIFSFIRRTNVPFKVNKKRGWGHKVLPLHMLILSPAKVMKEYGGLALEDKPVLKKLCRTIGKKIDLVFSDGKLNLGELVGLENKEGIFNLFFNFSNFAVKRLIEQIDANIDIGDLLKESINLLLKGEIRIGPKSPKKMEFTDKKFRDFSVDLKDNLSSDEKDKILSLYDNSITNYDVSFRREKKDLEHLLGYPKITDILLVRKNSKIVGFTVLGLRDGSDLKEIWVLELLYKDKNVKNFLLNLIENICEKKDLDSVLIISNLDNKNWTNIRYQTLMWKVVGDSKKNFETHFENNRWKINLYDIV